MLVAVLSISALQHSIRLVPWVAYREGNTNEMTTITTTITASKVVPTWSKELVKVTAVEKFADCLLLRWMTAEQVVKEADGDMSGDIDLVEFSDLCLNTTAPSAYGGGSRGSLPRG